MSEISSAGYQTVRDWMTQSSAWGFHALCNGADVELLRVNIDTDTRSSWTHVSGSQTLEVTTVIKGSDSEISASLPVTFAKSKMYKTSSGGSVLSTETFSSITLTTVNDQITVKHQIEVPEV